MSSFDDIVRAAQEKSLRVLENLIDIIDDPEAANKDRIAAAGKILAISTSPAAVKVMPRNFDEKSRIEQFRILAPHFRELKQELEAEGVDIARLEQAIEEEDIQYATE